MAKVDFHGDILSIPVAKGPWMQDIRVPGSKSLTNRALLIAALARGESVLDGVLHSDDTRHMLVCLQKLGAKYEVSGPQVRIEGLDGKPGPFDGELYVENAGTAARFLTAALILGDGRYHLTGNSRMQERPLSDLISPLNSLGCQITDIRGTGCPPLRISGGGFPGGKITVKGDKSSQYLSALMMVAPYARQDTELSILGSLVSRSYVEMTRKIMEDFGAVCHWLESERLHIKRGPYSGRRYEIEGDASSASYFFAAAAITGGEVRVRGLHGKSTQGDLGFLSILERMGCKVGKDGDALLLKGGPLRGVEVDLNTMSDVAPTLAAVALFAEGRTVIKNVANMRIKECDRISAMVKELRKTGALAEEWDDGFAVTGAKNPAGATFDTYDDHRMAMALALAGLKIEGVRIRNPSCVSKTFPDFFTLFFEVLARL